MGVPGSFEETFSLFYEIGGGRAVDLFISGIISSLHASMNIHVLTT